MCAIFRNNDNVKNWEYDENDGAIFSLFSGSSRLIHLVLEDSNLTTLGNITYHHNYILLIKGTF